MTARPSNEINCNTQQDYSVRNCMEFDSINLEDELTFSETLSLTLSNAVIRYSSRIVLT